MAGARAGFTIVQLLLALVILSLLAALSKPLVHRRIVNSRAEAVVQDLRAVKSAAELYRAGRRAWPPEAGRGVVPQGLEEYLPSGFSFRNPEYTLDFQNWNVFPDAEFQVAVTYSVLDAEVGREVMARLERGVWTDGGSRYTWAFNQ